MMSKETAKRLVRSGYASGDTIEQMLINGDVNQLDRYLEACREKANRDFANWVQEWNEKDYNEFRPLLIEILPAYMRSLFRHCAGDEKAVKGHIRQQSDFWDHYDVTTEINETYKAVRNEYA